MPYQAFPASDGYFIVACLTNAFFKRLCVALGREDWLNDPRYATNPAASSAAPRSVGILSEIFRTAPASIGSSFSKSTTSPPAA